MTKTDAGPVVPSVMRLITELVTAMRGTPLICTNPLEADTIVPLI